MGTTNTNYGLFFSKDNTTFRFPVNPEEWELSYGTDHEETNVLNVGPIVIPRTPDLAQISWEGFFPGDASEPYVLTAGGFKDPQFYIDTIREYMAALEPFNFIASRVMEDGSPIFDTNIKVVITEFEITEQGGETGDFYYSIKLQEYRSFEVQTITLIPPVATPLAPAPVQAVATPQRETASSVIVVGDEVIANGKYWYSSWGASPFGTANNKKIKVTRIIQNPTSGQDFPVCIGVLGWVKMDQLQKVT